MSDYTFVLIDVFTSHIELAAQRNTVYCYETRYLCVIENSVIST